MKLSDIKESKYLAKDDCGEEGIVVTIDRVSIEKVGEDMQGNAENKPVMHFKEQVKPLILNVTNFETIVHGTGMEDSDDWGGQKIKVYNDPTVSFAGRRTGGIRVRTPKKQAPQVEQVREQVADMTDDEIPFSGEAA